jgi:hypothetical protein
MRLLRKTYSSTGGEALQRAEAEEVTTTLRNAERQKPAHLKKRMSDEIELVFKIIR